MYVVHGGFPFSPYLSGFLIFLAILKIPRKSFVFQKAKFLVQKLFTKKFLLDVSV